MVGVGILTRVGGWWPTGDQRIQVVYTAGHATIPKGVKRATLRLAAAAWGNPELLSSETLGTTPGRGRPTLSA